jgi:hypothetical protein
MKKLEPVDKSYWVVMFDRDGGESDPVGFDCEEDAAGHAEHELMEWRWVTYEIQGGEWT